MGRKKSRKGKAKLSPTVSLSKLSASGYGESIESPHLLSVFPQEVWFMVTKHLKTTEDFQNLCASSTHFQTSLKPERIRLLFQKVASIMLECYSKCGRRACFNFHTLLKLRLVCSTWKQGIDKILETMEFHQLLTFQKYQKRRLFWEEADTMRPRISSVEAFSNFQSSFTDSHRNPFLTRAIKVEVSANLPNLDEFYTWIFSFLREHGTKIWYFEIVFDLDNIWQMVHYCHKLKSILKLLPNLKVLRCFSRTLFRLSPRAVQIIDLATAANPVPHLEHLQVFVQGGLPFPVTRSVLHSNPQIRKIEALHYVTSMHIKSILEMAPNVRELSLLLRDNVQFCTFESALYNSPVTKLHVSFQLLEVSLERIFSALENQFRNTLEELYIDMPRRNIKPVPERDLVLPKLKILHLRSNHAIQLDFLLPLRRTLQALSVFVTDFSVYTEVPFTETVITLYTHRTRIWRSNIWRIFGKMKQVTLRVSVDRVCTCTREQWNRLNELAVPTSG